MLNLTSSERKALFFVGFVVFVSLLIQWIRPHQLNNRLFDYTMQDSLFKVLSADTAFKSPPATEEKATLASQKKTASKKELQPHSININTATKEELMRLPRIGPVTAENILQFLKTNGPVRDVKQLLKVKRIGPKTLEKITPFLKIDSVGVK